MGQAQGCQTHATQSDWHPTRDRSWQPMPNTLDTYQQSYHCPGYISRHDYPPGYESSINKSCETYWRPIRERVIRAYDASFGLNYYAYMEGTLLEGDPYIKNPPSDRVYTKTIDCNDRPYWRVTRGPVQADQQVHMYTQAAQQPINQQRQIQQLVQQARLQPQQPTPPKPLLTIGKTPPRLSPQQPRHTMPQPIHPTTPDTHVQQQLPHHHHFNQLNYFQMVKMQDQGRRRLLLTTLNYQHQPIRA